MPILHIDHIEPFAAILGVMLYPEITGEDPKKARAFTSQYLAQPLKEYRSSGDELSKQALFEIETCSDYPLTDIDKRWWYAQMASEQFKIYFALYHTDEALAPWGNATKILESQLAKNRLKGLETTIKSAQRQFSRIAHLWAAFSLREWKFSTLPDTSYGAAMSFLFFLFEAEKLRDWEQHRRLIADKSKPPLGDDVWRMPPGWRPPEKELGWPDAAGELPIVKLSKEQNADLASPTSAERLIQNDGTNQRNEALIKAVFLAHDWRSRLETGAYPSAKKLGQATGYSERYVQKIIRLGFLSSAIVEAILEGRQPSNLTLHDLNKTPLTGDWGSQRETLGFTNSF
ncbi:MAG: hypothetical protein AAF720_07780 [Pseudomonadota bacterium]